MRRGLFVAYLVAVHIALGAGLFKAWASYTRPPGDIPVMREVHRQKDPHVPAGATIFLGDSLTMALPVAAIAPLAVNYGIGWQRSDQLLESMELYGSMQRAARVVVMIGTNDLLQGRAEGLESRYRAILARVPPGVPVTLSSIPPSTRYDTRPAAEAARTACASDPRCRFVDAFSALSAPGSLLPDGVHLSPVGYARLIEALRGAVDRAPTA